MSCDVAVEAINLTKCYQIYDKPQDRLKQALWRGRKQFYRSFFALRNASFELKHGEVLGIVGVNGAGKSTLLQLVCGTLAPSSGNINVNGRVSALLELGSGFHPEFTGRENVYMNAAILGLSRKEIDERYEAIVRFADIGDFIHQPVKTYSSGMRMRLAFAVAVNVDPDILIIDEALSVGDGAFSRKSFDRIMALRDAGKTILFCTHSTYQMEVLCNRALWLNRGEIQSMGEPSVVAKDYQAYLDGLSHTSQEAAQATPDNTAKQTRAGKSIVNQARITDIRVMADGVNGRKLPVISRETELKIYVVFTSNPAQPAPTLGLSLCGKNGRMISSASSKNDGIILTREDDGKGTLTVVFPRLPLLKGDYYLDVYLLCENGLKVWDRIKNVAEINVKQKGLEQGIVSLPHTWHIEAVK